MPIRNWEQFNQKSRLPDANPDRTVSSARRWQRRKRAERKCVICGEAAAPSRRKGTGGYSQYCPTHVESQRAYQKQYQEAHRSL